MYQFTNFKAHPSQVRYMVYWFHSKEQADYFQGLLQEQNIQFQNDVEEGRYFFATKKGDDKKVRNLNFLTIGKYRKPFIPQKWLRWAVVIIPFAIIILAIFGYIVSG